MMSNVPDSAIITIVIAALGVLSTAIKGFVETRKSVNENRFLKARLQELDAENKVYKAHFLPPLPTPTVTTAAAS